jgi:hypothetical protein
VTLKKTAHASEQQCPDVLRRRGRWFEAPIDLEREWLVFIDETGASTKMARRHGRAPRSERAQPLEDDDLRRRRIGPRVIRKCLSTRPVIPLTLNMFKWPGAANRCAVLRFMATLKDADAW